MKGNDLKDVSVSEIAFIAGTRAAIGVGAGLLLANKLSTKRRKAVGIPLLLLGILSTIPIAMDLFNKKNNSNE